MPTVCSMVAGPSRVASMGWAVSAWEMDRLESEPELHVRATPPANAATAVIFSSITPE